ncbi:unnamed protein product [Echinostoma caproni]|uniref:G_PROTEIN_RECEP_F1_2 domain-containing protein n=1 Tax=Echinostoma caproni TaxID=27848 RepID=A0A183ACH2_9TREM|nr:unnamed protein product [Echinostoma caproni]
MVENVSLTVPSASGNEQPGIVPPQRIVVNVFKGICFFGIILTALFGNCLVLIAVTKFKRIRSVRTNIFLVSLALADFLVALLVMPFSAIMGLMEGRWIFGSVLCDLFNANDVLFSTASILHLCCISTERYIAVLSPLTYERKMTCTRIAVMLTVTWLLSILISYLPIFTGLYTTSEHKDYSGSREEWCEFVVNPYYALISSATSFWIPSFVMIAVYVRIFIEARNQEKKIYRLHVPAKRRKSVPPQTSEPEEANLETELVSSDNNTDSRPGHQMNYLTVQSVHSSSHSVCNHKTKHAAHSSMVTADQMKIRRENKAAKTLGIIMGAFLLCWLPFFLWYTITNLCGGNKQCKYPEIIGNIMFWIGYFNSTLNPMIYAFYNRTFRNAFKRILTCNRRNNSRSMVVDMTKGRRTNPPGTNTNGMDISQHSYRP